MWPIGHIASGVLIERAVNSAPDSKAYAALLIGVLFPDIIDKPLGVLNVVPAYHTVAHSLFSGAFVTILGYVLGEEKGILHNFAVGYVTHILADLLLTMDKWDQVEFFFWPVLRPENTVNRAVSDYVADYMTSPWFALELVLAGLALLPIFNRITTIIEQQR